MWRLTTRRITSVLIVLRTLENEADLNRFPVADLDGAWLDRSEARACSAPRRVGKREGVGTPQIHATSLRILLPHRPLADHRHPLNRVPQVLDIERDTRRRREPVRS